MDTTSVSLLERLRQPTQHEAWTWFVDLYTPLIYYWARRAGLYSGSREYLPRPLTRLAQQSSTCKHHRAGMSQSASFAAHGKSGDRILRFARSVLGAEGGQFISEELVQFE